MYIYVYVYIKAVIKNLLYNLKFHDFRNYQVYILILYLKNKENIYYKVCYNII